MNGECGARVAYIFVKLTTVSLPFDHPGCPEKKGSEKSRVRGRYVSVELVQELNDDSIEWRMATSSDAGGNIPRFVTNGALPKSISEDVPSFLKWMVRKHPAAAARNAAILEGRETPVAVA